MAKDAIVPPLFAMVTGQAGIVRMRIEDEFEMLRIATGSLTVIEMVVNAAPPVLFAQIVQTLVVMFAVGAPLTEPVIGLKTNPSGSAGWIAQTATTPPVFVMFSTVIGTPRVSVIDARDGEGIAMGSLIVMLMLTELAPPELLAHMV